VQRLALPLVVGPDDLDGPVVVAPDRDRLGDGVRQLALGALDRHVLTLDGDIDTGRDGDGELADSRHL
jgi:hypothetical protein